MGFLSKALAIGTNLINKVATLCCQKSKRRRAELQQGGSEADGQREEGVISAGKQIVEHRLIIEHVFRPNEVAATKREDAALQTEVAAKLRDEAVALLEAEKAKEALKSGIRSLVMPNPEQFAAAKERIQFDPEKVHIAVCGTSGSGKSTIINAFRGLGDYIDGAARVRLLFTETECTSKVTRYPELRKDTPYSRFVWYDIPGAGTTAVSGQQYFNDQGLFVFDIIILMYDDWFTVFDVGIIENCLRSNIPVLIVRSKADKHIGHMMQARNCELFDVDYNEVYGEMVKNYGEATRSEFDKHMQTMAEGPEFAARDRQILKKQRVYIVAATQLRGLSKNITKYTRRVDERKIIDERFLLEDVVKAAVNLRRLDQAR